MAILVLEHSDESGSERLGEALRDFGHRLTVLQLHDGDALPGDLDDVDGIISCGGPQSAYDDSHSWLAQEMQLMREAHAIQMPVVGLCLGSQILARALGGAVEKNPAGIELGWHEVKLTPVGREDILHTGLPWASMQMHHHGDHVATLPPGAKLLASSKKTKAQAWSCGLRSYGFQYHPEASMRTIENWATDAASIKEAGITSEHLLAEAKKHYASFERLGQRLFESIGLFLMPVDRRYQGAIKDLHY